MKNLTGMNLKIQVIRLRCIVRLMRKQKIFASRCMRKGCGGAMEKLYSKTQYGMYIAKKTCYVYGVSFSHYKWAKKKGYRILEWSDYMQKEFIKADLRDGMVVEQRDGGMYLVLAGTTVGKGEHNSIVGYTDGLKWAGYKGGDIVKVYRITPGSLGCIEDVFIKSNLELIWERKEPKKMTVEEMRKKLEELTGEQIEVTA